MEKSIKPTIVAFGGLIVLGLLLVTNSSDQPSTTDSKAKNVINQFTERIKSIATPKVQPTSQPAIEKTPESGAEAEAISQAANIVWPDDSTIDWKVRQQYLDKFGIDVTESPIPVYLPDPEVIGEGEVFWSTQNEPFPEYHIGYQADSIRFDVASWSFPEATPEVVARSAKMNNPDYQIGLEGGACLITWGDVGLSYHVTVSGQDAVSHDKALMFCESQESAAEFVQSFKYFGGQGH